MDDTEGSLLLLRLQVVAWDYRNHQSELVCLSEGEQ